jgi:hypothetical protein
MFGNIGGLISTWSFLPSDAPNFRIGNGLNLATSSVILITSILLGIWIEGLTQQKIQDLDWRHPAFRWRP